MASDTEKETKAAAAAGIKTEPGLRIRSLRDGFRLAGRPWSTTPTEVRAGDFTEAQIAALKAEPLLAVEDIELAVELEK
jgi:hypothetical protein